MFTRVSIVHRTSTILLIAAVLLGGFASFSLANEQEDAVIKAVSYLKNQPVNSDITMALVATGEPVNVEYLKSFSGTNALAYAKPMLALTAAGKDPRTFPNEDFVAKMKSFARDNQLGEVSQVNDDIWGILALASAGVAESDSIIQNSKTFVLNNQNSDGGWAWNAGGTSDTNDAAAAIMALLEAGTPRSDSAIQSAVSYLKSAQNEDGGFPYQAGYDSDGNSDAWILMAFNKLGESTTEPVLHLLSLQDEDGGFWWMQPPAGANNKGPTADAVIALTGKSFPVGKISAPLASEVFFRIVGSAGELCKGALEAANAMDVVVNAAAQCGYTYVMKETSFGPYLFSINNDSAEGVKGWLYRVNGVLPNIGAAAFALSGGEQVLWYYGEFDDEPPASSGVSDSVSLSVEIVSDDDGGGGGGVPEIGFSVTPSSLNLGKLEPGNKATGKVVLQNEGQRNLIIEAQITGDSVFHFLKIEHMLWDVFKTLLRAPLEKEVNIDLSIPARFSSFGQKQGTLILWGQSE
ncbi:MAG: DUF4430 domain-containing protein [Patescibacteria group bacterium]